MTVCVCLLSCA